ncbi:GntR family transcriptional regulator [Paeniglutamicibacter kerguelensis]|uniref:DNA-binding GntR family transcriptional regulator n=1 Tax=Paeniglutamicibacter kerguelensis TaxID=254788 RepID=A0ABS4XCI4_9MICC|nr:GntR family transcriptional regulator [Paeniglutamicibacter kerguelensis]MBP2386187.1 DNA-binding GntR family transcriptional regulator [Paeniglutamicibacter kerguelensis]
MGRDQDHDPFHVRLTGRGGEISLRQQVSDALRDALVAGTLIPGKIYSAPALAEMLGVSPTPVREAMIDIAREGLVEALRNKGYLIKGFSDRDLDELAALRTLIEVPTMVQVTHQASVAELEELRPLAEVLNETARRGALREFVAADTEFHLRALALSGNRQLVNNVRRLRSMARLSGLQQLADAGELLATAREHGEMLDLMVARDAEGVAELMRRHIGHTRGVWAGQAESGDGPEGARRA